MADQTDPTDSTGAPSGPSTGDAPSSASAPRRPRGRDRELMEAIAADLRAMRGKVEVAHDLAHQHAGFLSETLPRLDAIEARIAALTGRVNALTGADSDDDEDTGPYNDTLLTAYGLLPDPEHQVDWHLMSAAQARPAWEALAAWVAAVVCGRLRFTRAQLPDCWALHPPAVHALSWAHQLHRTLAGNKVGALHLAEFDTRWLPHLHTRIAAAIELDLLDPRGRDDTRTPTTAPRCRLGHYHLLTGRSRKMAEAQLDQSAAQPARRGEQGDPSRLTGPGFDPAAALRDPAGVRRALGDRRAQAQRVLDDVLPGQASRDRHPDRPRYLPVHPADDHPERHPAATQPAHPAIWLPIYRQAAAADLANRRHHEQHPEQLRPDVALDPAVHEHDHQ